jgi:hypothetical protein
LLSSAGVCFCSYHTICKARPVDLSMQSIFPQEGRAGCTRYNGNHTPNALDCRATPSSVSTLAVMAARGCCFLECFSWRRKRAVIDTILRRCIGYRSRDVLRQDRALCNLTGVPYKLSAGTRRFKFGDVVPEPYGMLTVPLRTPGGIVFFFQFMSCHRTCKRLGA